MLPPHTLQKGEKIQYAICYATHPVSWILVHQIMLWLCLEKRNWVLLRKYLHFCITISGEVDMQSVSKLQWYTSKISKRLTTHKLMKISNLEWFHMLLHGSLAAARTLHATLLATIYFASLPGSYLKINDVHIAIAHMSIARYIIDYKKAR